MEVIAGEASVSTATLYRHFRSKVELFEAVATASIEALETQASLAQSEDPMQRLAALSRAYAILLSDPNTIGMVRMIVSETGRNPDLAERFYTAIKSRLGDNFERAIEDLAEAGHLIDAPRHSAPGQLQAMIEHGILMRGLILGDDAGPAAPVEDITRDALATWTARWMR